MTVESLHRLVRIGEGAGLEFKRRVPAPERVVKEIVAFANTNGGHVLLGVADDGSITGLKDVLEELFLLEQAMERHCRPPVELVIERVPISRKREVIVVGVPNSPLKPHYVQDTDGSRSAYVRVRDESVEASREAVRLMKHERSKGDRAGVRFEFGERS